MLRNISRKCVNFYGYFKGQLMPYDEREIEQLLSRLQQAVSAWLPVHAPSEGPDPVKCEALKHAAFYIARSLKKSGFVVDRFEARPGHTPACKSLLNDGCDCFARLPKVLHGWYCHYCGTKNTRMYDKCTACNSETSLKP
jgi:hypothetical protein